MYKVSVIVPVYNVERYLRKCLDSLVNQTLADIEIIVVNDGSPDHSQSIIDEYVKSYPSKVFSYQKENGGLSSARNFGLQKAHADYVAFVDSDDWLETTMYEKLYKKAITNNFDLVVCDFNEIRNDKKCPCTCNMENDIYHMNDIKHAMVNFYPSAWNKLYKKEALTRSNTLFKEGIWFEDVEFIFRFLPYIRNIGVVKEHLYNYLIRQGSITATADMRIFDYIDNWNGVIEYYKDNRLYDEYKEELEYNYVRYLFATFIKTSCKFDKATYQKAVKAAFGNVQKNFPLYKKNKYIKQKGIKNLYLKMFSFFIANIVYIKYHR